jgi:hypothetical protein
MIWRGRAVSHTWSEVIVESHCLLSQQVVTLCKLDSEGFVNYAKLEDEVLRLEQLQFYLEELDDPLIDKSHKPRSTIFGDGDFKASAVKSL